MIAGGTRAGPAFHGAPGFDHRHGGCRLYRPVLKALATFRLPESVLVESLAVVMVDAEMGAWTRLLPGDGLRDSASTRANSKSMQAPSWCGRIAQRYRSRPDPPPAQDAETTRRNAAEFVAVGEERRVSGELRQGLSNSKSQVSACRRGSSWPAPARGVHQDQAAPGCPIPRTRRASPKRLHGVGPPDLRTPDRSRIAASKAVAGQQRSRSPRRRLISNWLRSPRSVAA